MKKQYTEKMIFDEIIDYLRNGETGRITKSVTVHIPTIHYMIEGLEYYRTSYQKYKKIVLDSQKNTPIQQAQLELDMLESILKGMRMAKTLGLKSEDCGFLSDVVQFYNQNFVKINDWYKISHEDKKDTVNFWDQLHKFVNESVQKSEAVKTKTSNGDQQAQMIKNSQILETQNINLKKLISELQKQNSILKQDNDQLKSQYYEQIKNYYQEFKSNCKDPNFSAPGVQNIQLKLESQIKRSKELEKSNSQLKQECEKLKELLQVVRVSQEESGILQEKLKQKQARLQELEILRQAKAKQMADAELEYKRLNSEVSSLKNFSQVLASPEKAKREDGNK